LQENIYISNEEAYIAIAKTLLHDHTCCGHISNPSQIISRHLLPSQRKQFADAHMEQAVSISSYPEQGETPKTSILRRIDNIFGESLLEFFASKDGNIKTESLSSPYISSPFPSTPKRKAKYSTLNKRNTDESVRSGCANNRDFEKCDIENNMNTRNLSSKQRIPILPPWPSQKEQNEESLQAENKVADDNLSLSEENPIERKYESSFDRIFHADTDPLSHGEKKDKIQRQQSDSVNEGLDINLSYADIGSETFSIHSSSCASKERHSGCNMNGTQGDLQKEMLAEMIKTNDIINKTTEKEEREAYNARLDNLIKEFNSTSNHSENFVQCPKSENQDNLKQWQSTAINSENDSEHRGSNTKTTPDNDTGAIFRSQEVYKPPTLSQGMVDGENENGGEVSSNIKNDTHLIKDRFLERSPHVYSRSVESQESEDEDTCLRYVSIRAPTRMQENFTFEAKYRGTSFLARVVSTFKCFDQ
jgi:hypothetical protein